MGCEVDSPLGPMTWGATPRKCAAGAWHPYSLVFESTQYPLQSLCGLIPFRFKSFLSEIGSILLSDTLVSERGSASVHHISLLWLLIGVLSLLPLPQHLSQGPLTPLHSTLCTKDLQPYLVPIPFPSPARTGLIFVPHEGQPLTASWVPYHSAP